MRILHIDTGAEMRGGQRQVLLLIDGLREAGHESLLLAREESPLWNAASDAGIPVSPADPKQVWQRSRAATVVHAHDARAHTIAAVASRRKFVVSRRVAFPVKRSVASTWKYHRAARFLAVSEFVANQLKAAGIRSEKIDVVYDAVGEVPRAEEWNPRHPAIALASRDPEKGRELVERAAEMAGIPVTFSDNLTLDLQRASMFVYITRSEGLGSAALVAMKMGAPVIASRTGGLTEVFEEGVSGIFVENEVAQIAAAMRRVLEEPDLAPRLIHGGKLRIAERFTREHLVAGTLASYGSALGS